MENELVTGIVEEKHQLPLVTMVWKSIPWGWSLFRNDMEATDILFICVPRMMVRGLYQVHLHEGGCLLLCTMQVQVPTPLGLSKDLPKIRK